MAPAREPYNCNTGGWGAILQQGRRLKEIYGEREHDQPAHGADCLYRALKDQVEENAVEVYTDSAYLVNCMQKKWYVTWQKNDGVMPPENRWKTATSGKASLTHLPV
jgi:ribonuclease HI